MSSNLLSVMGSGFFKQKLDLTFLWLLYLGWLCPIVYFDERSRAGQMKSWFYGFVVAIILFLILMGAWMVVFTDSSSSMSAIGVNILGGGVVSGVFLLIQSIIYLAQKKQTQIEMLRQQLQTSSDIGGIVLNGKDLSGMYLPNKIMTAAQVVGVNLSGAVCIFSDMRFVDLRGAILKDCDLRGANMIHANLRGAVLCGALFDDVDASNGDWRQVNASDILFVGVNFRGVNFVGANLLGAQFDNCILDEAIFDVGVLGAKFKNVQYDALTIWPEGFNPPASVLADFVDYKELTLPQYLEKKKNKGLSILDKGS